MLDPDAQTPPSDGPGADTKASFALSRLRRAFVTCELHPGSFLAEPEIAERFFLGRAAVRSALARLEVEGYVRVAPRAGWQVAPITGASISEICNAWEMFAQALHSRNFTPQVLQQLEVLAARADALLGRNEPQVIAASRAVQREFMTLLGQSGGALIGSWMKQCLDRTERLIHCFERSNPRLLALALTPLTQHLTRRDGSAAARALQDLTLHLRDWLSLCLIHAEDLVLQCPQDARPAASQAARPQAHTTTMTKKPKQGTKNQ